MATLQLRGTVPRTHGIGPIEPRQRAGEITKGMPDLRGGKEQGGECGRQRERLLHEWPSRDRITGGPRRTGERAERGWIMRPVGHHHGKTAACVTGRADRQQTGTELIRGGHIKNNGLHRDLPPCVLQHRALLCNAASELPGIGQHQRYAVIGGQRVAYLSKGVCGIEGAPCLKRTRSVC